MDKEHSGPRERPSAREWVIGIAVLVIVTAIMVPTGLLLAERTVALTEAMHERGEQIDIILDHAAEEAREEERGER